MAKGNAAAARAEERAEREFNADINEAIARTEDEVFTEAMGDEPMGEDVDTSLEEMGDGLEGDELDDDEIEAGEAAESEQEEAGDQGQGDQDQDQVREPPREERSRIEQRGSIPPRVVRELGDRARGAESEAATLRAQVRDLQLRLDNVVLQRSPQAPARTEPEAEPDMFRDPKGYQEWVLKQAEQRAQARMDERLNAFQRDQQMQSEMRLNESLNAVASGPRGYEFNVAYNDFRQHLDSLPPEQAGAMVRRLMASPDPGHDLLSWWERTSNPEYVEFHREQIRQAYAPRQNNGAPQRGLVRHNAQPRHEVRLPRSLSSATGGRSQHVDDPAMWDGSEASVFDFGTRR